MKTKILSLRNRKDIDSYRKFMTEERLNILKLVHREKPTSIKDLSNRLDRDYRNVYKDIVILRELKLLKIKKNNGSHIPIVEYGLLKIEIVL